MTFNINTATTREIRTETRNLFGSNEIAVWMTGRNRIEDGEPLTRQSDMRTDDWKACYADLLETLSGVTVDVTAPAPKPKAEPKAQHITGPGGSLDLNKTLDGLGMVLSDQVVTTLREGIASIERERDTARQMAQDAANRPPEQIVIDNTPTAANQAAPVTSQGKRNLADLFPRTRTLSARGIMVDVCDCDAALLDPNFAWPKETPDIFAALVAGLNVLIFGAKGTGKSSFARNVAAITKRPYFQIGFHAETSSAELFGFWGPDANGGMAWVPGDLLTAMQTPWAVIDLSEISFARPELTSQLLSVTESTDRSVTVGGVTYKVHPTVWFIATSNDNGSGEDSHRYHGTRALNPALVSRFQYRVEFNTPEPARLGSIIAKAAQVPAPMGRAIADFEKEMEKGIKNGDCEDSPGIRSCIAWATMVRMGMPSKEAFKVTVLNSASSDDQMYWGQRAAALDPHAEIDRSAKASPAQATQDDDQSPSIDVPTRSGFTPTA